MMDDLGYGQFAINNDALGTDSFDPFFVKLVKDHQDYTPEEALEFSKIAIPTMNSLARKGVQFRKGDSQVFRQYFDTGASTVGLMDAVCS